MTIATLLSANEAETAAIARRVAALLEPGDVMALNGSLGAGKTRFVQGLTAALGCADAFVASPTFVLVHEYAGRLPIFHVDAYRLRDADEFRELGGEELADSGGVLCVEWADRIADALPGDLLRLEITALGATERRLEFSAAGGRGQELVAALRSQS